MSNCYNNIIYFVNYYGYVGGGRVVFYEKMTAKEEKGEKEENTRTGHCIFRSPERGFMVDFHYI